MTSTTVAQTLRDAAREYHDVGLCVLPIKADGSKAADVRSWTPYKVTRSTPEEHDKWFAPGRTAGMAVVYGSVSGGVELIEFEGHAVEDGILEAVTDIMEASGLGPEWDAITTGWATESPSGGLHLRVRVTGGPVPGNTKLASRLAREDEYTPEERQRLAEKPNSRIIRVQIETRGEGGYGLVEPSAGTVHASGLPYQRVAGGPETIPVLAADVMGAVREICRMVDSLPKAETPKSAPRDPRPLPGGQVRPGEDFEARVDWADILQPEGWTFVTQRGGTRYWRRPGKDRGLSATTGHAADRDRLFVFTSSTDFQQEVPYTKFGAYALLHHAGDHKAAARSLRGKGYGDATPHRSLAPVSHLPVHRPAPPVDGALALHYDPEQEPDLPEDPGPQARPEVDITNEADGIDGVLAVMASGVLPGLYKRSGGPCWVDEDDQGNPQLVQLSSDNLRAYLADHLQTYTVAKDEESGGTKAVRTLLNPRTCSTILGRKDWPLNKIKGVVTSPVLRPDATLITQPGYDSATGLYLHPRVPLRRLAPEVTLESVAKAKHIVLGQMLADFPWQAPSDRAHFLGALLTPIVRPYFHGTTPMFVITATAAGSGKSLLKDAFQYFYGIASTPWPENDAELRKAVTTQLYTTGQPVVALDNLPNGHIIKSPILSALLTEEVWRDRILGSTASVAMPNDRLWIATGNSLRTGGDNGRRVMWVRLDPDCPDPDQRDGYTVGDLRPWLRTNASTVVAALVTMVRGWVAAGARTVRVRKGDYSEWASLIAGILDYLGVLGWMADRDEATAMDDELQEWQLFLEMWREKFGERGVTTGEALGALKEYVPTQRDELPSAKQLGHWLKARQGRYFGTHKLVQFPDSHRKQNVWRVDVHDSNRLPTSRT
ncbi:bifunctional DNA primase/polymerase [Kitasatospora sp. MBT66]|uniref:bifunctional DNA primase/polymerase n=1 Tax=Kitasatospora sp. MBT66 TaxID=1444769 RepID=UPI0006920D88|nr:bifunctional DNA primase/polymerase [Kitasatospora sp. MBT66]